MVIPSSKRPCVLWFTSVSLRRKRCRPWTWTLVSFCSVGCALHVWASPVLMHHQPCPDTNRNKPRYFSDEGFYSLSVSESEKRSSLLLLPQLVLFFLALSLWQSKIRYGLPSWRLSNQSINKWQPVIVTLTKSWLPLIDCCEETKESWTLSIICTHLINNVTFFTRSSGKIQADSTCSKIHIEQVKVFDNVDCLVSSQSRVFKLSIRMSDVQDLGHNCYLVLIIRQTAVIKDSCNKMWDYLRTQSLSGVKCPILLYQINEQRLL